MSAWERVLRMLRIHRDPDPDDGEDRDLTKAREKVESLHRESETVLSDYAAADRRTRNGHR